MALDIEIVPAGGATGASQVVPAGASVADSGVAHAGGGSTEEADASPPKTIRYVPPRKPRHR